MTIIYCEVPDDRRMSHTAALFGVHFPLALEPAIFSVAERLSPDYKGGFWQFRALCNGGFYMAPASPASFDVRCENGFDGRLSADALGLTSCLYAYSELSFGEGELGKLCGRHYLRLRDFMLDHVEARLMLGAID